MRTTQRTGSTMVALVVALAVPAAIVGVAPNAAAQPPIGPIQAAMLRAAATESLIASTPVVDAAWLRVQQIGADREISVKRRSGATVRGWSVTVDSSSISVRPHNSSTVEQISKADITEVKKLRAYRIGDPKLGATLMGLAGMIIAPIVAAHASGCYEIGCLPVGLVAMPAGAVGGAIGGRYLFSHPFDETIYTAP